MPGQHTPYAVERVKGIIATGVTERFKKENAFVSGGAACSTEGGLGSLVPRGGLEPPTHGFSVHCSTS